MSFDRLPSCPPKAKVTFKRETFNAEGRRSVSEDTFPKQQSETSANVNNPPRNRRAFPWDEPSSMTAVYEVPTEVSRLTIYNPSQTSCHPPTSVISRCKDEPTASISRVRTPSGAGLYGVNGSSPTKSIPHHDRHGASSFATCRDSGPIKILAIFVTATGHDNPRLTNHLPHVPPTYRQPLRKHPRPMRLSMS